MAWGNVDADGILKAGQGHQPVDVLFVTSLKSAGVWSSPKRIAWLLTSNCGVRP